MRAGLTFVCAGALLATAPAAVAQSDPFGALYGSQPGAPAAAVGSTSVETAVGRSYAASQEKGAMSMAQIAFLPKTIAPLPVKVDTWNGKFLSRRPRIAIATYALAVTRGAQASASGAGNGSEITPRRTKIATFLNGVSDDLAARLAQEAYDDLAARLTQAGFDVVPAAEAAAAPHMEKAARYPGGANGKNPFAAWATYAPAQAPLIKGYAGEQGMGAMAAAGASLALGHVSKELDAIVLMPRLQLDSVQMDSTGQRTFVANASVDAKVWFSASGAAPFIWGNERGGTMPGQFTLKPHGSAEPFAIMVKADDRSDSKTLHNALVEAGFGSIYRQSLVYAVEADPGRYAALARAAFQGFNAAMVEEIRRARSQ